jgi:hypothetical protein
MEEKLLEMLEEFKKCACKCIEKDGFHTPLCIPVNKNNSIKIIGFPFKNLNEKEILKNWLKDNLVKSDIKAYFIIVDTKMTSYSEKEKEREVKDALIINLYTASEKICWILPYKDKTMIQEFIKIEGRGGNDSFDIWGEGF